MTGEEIVAARARLGELWGLGRPLHRSELGRVLRLRSRDPGNLVARWERGSVIPGPATAAIDMMLAGAPPPNGLVPARHVEPKS
jgi:hypothetical protein